MLTSTGATEPLPLPASPEGETTWCERSTCRWFARVHSPCLFQLGVSFNIYELIMKTSDRLIPTGA